MLPNPSAPRARRFRYRRRAPPAPAPSSSVSKPFAAARRTPRSASRPTDRSIRKPWCGSHCYRRSRPTTIRRTRRSGRSRRTVTALSWRKAPVRWCWKAMRPPPHAAPRSSASLPVAANSPIHSTAPDRVLTANRSSDACETRCRMPASVPNRSITSMPTAPARRKTTRWNIWASRRCSATAPARFRCLPTSRWSATPSPRPALSKRCSRC